jgi:hypothetical protein
MNEEILRAMYKARLLEQDPASYEYRWNADGVRKLERGLEREIPESPKEFAGDLALTLTSIFGHKLNLDGLVGQATAIVVNVQLDASGLSLEALENRLKLLRGY